MKKKERSGKRPNTRGKSPFKTNIVEIQSRKHLRTPHTAKPKKKTLKKGITWRKEEHMDLQASGVSARKKKVFRRNTAARQNFG